MNPKCNYILKETIPNLWNCVFTEGLQSKSSFTAVTADHTFRKFHISSLKGPMKKLK